MPDLRDDILRLFVELLLLVPLPWRSCLVVFVLLLLVSLIPAGLLVAPFVWTLRQFMRLGIWLAIRSQGLAVNRGRSRMIDAFDRLCEFAIHGFGHTLDFLRTKLAVSMGWGKLKMGHVVLLSSLPAILWFVRPFLGDITVGRLIDTGFATLIAAEQWVITGTWVTPESPEDSFPTRNNQPVVSTDGNQEQAQDSQNDPVHTVRQGETLKGIARQYGIRMQCIIDVNRPRFKRFNPDSLDIGMQLIIPMSDLNCHQ